MNKMENGGFNVAGKLATLNLQRGLTYNQIQIVLDTANGLTANLLKNIKVRLNQKVILEIDPARYLKVDKYRSNNSTDPEIINIDFTEIDAKNSTSEFAGIIGTAPYSTMNEEMRAMYPAALGVDVTDFRIEIEAVDNSVPLQFLTSLSWVSAPSPLSRRIFSLLPRSLNIAGAGVWDIELPFGAASAHDIKRVWLFERKEDVGGGVTTDPKKINAVTCRKDSVDVLFTTRKTNEYDQRRYKGLPDDEFYCLDFGMANYNVQELLITQNAADVRLKVTTTGATTIDYWIEAYSDLLKL